MAAATEAYRADVLRRRQFVITNYGALTSRKHQKWYPYFVLAATELRGCGDGSLPAYMTSVRDVPDPALPGAIAPEMFSEPPLVRYLFRYGHCLSSEQAASLLRSIETPQRWFGHGTLNMASILTTSAYLLAQRFPRAVLSDVNGRRYTSAEVTRLLKAAMVRRYRKFLRDGDAEALSPTYAQVSLFSALNLVEFAEDGELRAYAEAYAIQLLALLRASSFQGVILAPIHRQNAQQRSGPASAPHPCVSPTQHALSIYFGEPRLGRWDVDSGCEPTYATMFAASDWLPPVALSRFPDPAALPSRQEVAIPTFSIGDAPTRPAMTGTIYREQLFAIGAANATFNPRGYNLHDSTFSLAYDRAAEYNYIECFHPYWMSNAGIDAWTTSRTPPGFAPNLTSRSSPFQQSHFHRGRGVLLFSIPDTDPWPNSEDPRMFAARDRQKDALFARQNCHFPRDVDAYRVDGSWTFIDAGKVHIGIETVGRTPAIQDGPTDPLMKSFINIAAEGRHSAIFVVVEEAKGPFAAFQQSAKAIPRRHDPERDTFTFQDEDGRSREVTFSLRPEPGTGFVASIPTVTVDGQALPPGTGLPLAAATHRIGGGRTHIPSPLGDLEILLPEHGPPRIIEGGHPRP